MGYSSQKALSVGYPAFRVEMCDNDNINCGLVLNMPLHMSTAKVVAWCG